MHSITKYQNKYFIIAIAAGYRHVAESFPRSSWLSYQALVCSIHYFLSACPFTVAAWSQKTKAIHYLNIFTVNSKAAWCIYCHLILI